MKEYAATWVILIVGAIKSLDIAVAVGAVIALLIFVWDYAGEFLACAC